MNKVMKVKFVNSDLKKATDAKKSKSRNSTITYFNL